MQSQSTETQSTEEQSVEVPEIVLTSMTSFTEFDPVPADDSLPQAIEPTRFASHFVGEMEMYADAQTVAEYLNVHQGWFCRCAHPMKVEPLGVNGYAITIGKFGSFGYEVEPKIGLNLLPPDAQGVYRIETIPVPDYRPPGYEVDFQAALQLLEEQTPADLLQSGKEPNRVSPVMTRVEWHLDLAVLIQFPKFIQALPKSVIQSTGDRVLNQIVRQISRRLTLKVQEDFHTTLQLAYPKKSKKR